MGVETLFHCQALSEPVGNLRSIVVSLTCVGLSKQCVLVYTDATNVWSK